MDKTKVDDMLIEMITPKVKEIEKKFGNGEGLTQEDINTLLLKSQYNHINHLDMKLNEVTADVASLKGEFKEFKNEINNKFDGLSGEFNTKFAQLETKFEQAQVKMQDTIISTMRWYIGGAGVVLIVLKALELFAKT